MGIMHNTTYDLGYLEYELIQLYMGINNSKKNNKVPKNVLRVVEDENPYANYRDKDTSASKVTFTFGLSDLGVVVTHDKCVEEEFIVHYLECNNGKVELAAINTTDVFSSYTGENMIPGLKRTLAGMSIRYLNIQDFAACTDEEIEQMKVPCKISKREFLNYLADDLCLCEDQKYKYSRTVSLMKLAVRSLLKAKFQKLLYDSLKNVSRDSEVLTSKHGCLGRKQILRERLFKGSIKPVNRIISKNVKYQL